MMNTWFLRNNGTAGTKEVFLVRTGIKFLARENANKYASALNKRKDTVLLLLFFVSSIKGALTTSWPYEQVN